MHVYCACLCTKDVFMHVLCMRILSMVSSVICKYIFVFGVGTEVDSLYGCSSVQVSVCVSVCIFLCALSTERTVYMAVFEVCVVKLVLGLTD